MNSTVGIAYTNSYSFREGVSPQTSLVYQGHHTNIIANIPLMRFGLTNDATTKTRTMSGNARNRMRASSSSLVITGMEESSILV